MKKNDRQGWKGSKRSTNNHLTTIYRVKCKSDSKPFTVNEDVYIKWGVSAQVTTFCTAATTLRCIVTLMYDILSLNGFQDGYQEFSSRTNQIIHQLGASYDDPSCNHFSLACPLRSPLSCFDLSHVFERIKRWWCCWWQITLWISFVGRTHAQKSTE